MLLLASLVAGLATMPYAAFHFHRVTPYGVLANLAAMPVVSALVMPAGPARPGRDAVRLRRFLLVADGHRHRLDDRGGAMGRGLPGAVGRMAAFGIAPLIAASLGIIVMGLLRTPLRWSGAAALALAVVWAVSAPQPDILISADGRNIGRPRQGWAAASDAQRQGCVPDPKEWLAADADARQAGDASLADGVSCDDSGCVTAGGRRRAGGAGAAARGACRRLRARGADRHRAAGAARLRRARDRCRTAAAAGRAGAAADPRRICRSRRSNPAGSTGRGRRQWLARARRRPASARPRVHLRARSMPRRRKRTCRRTIRSASLARRARDEGWAGNSNAPR